MLKRKKSAPQRSVQWYGWSPDLPDFRDFTFSAPEPILADLPPVIDLRPLCPEVYNQGRLGCCTGNAIAAVHQFNQIKQKLKEIFIPSRLFIYYNEREMEGRIEIDCGARLRDGIKSINQLGVCPETMWPYDITKFKQKPTKECYDHASEHQALEYSRVSQDLEQLRGCLASGFPFVFGFAVYNFFESREMATTGMLRMPTSSERMLGGHAVTCLHEDTKISLLDGREISLKDANEEFKDKYFWVYSCDENGRIVSGKAHSIKKTGENKKLLLITLDNNKTIKCTLDHKFLMRDGTYKEAKDLKENDSLMPLYRKKSNEKIMKNYEMVLQPNTHKWQYTHRVVMSCNERYHGVVHHKNFDKNDNSPDNLEIMTWEKHTQLHKNQCSQLEKYSKSEIGRKKSRENMKKLWLNKEWKEKSLIRNKENGKLVSKKLKEEGRCGFQAMNPKRLKEMNYENGLKSSKFLHTKKSEQKSAKKLREKFNKDIVYKNKKQKIARENISKYNELLKSGKIQITEKQKESRRFNILKAIWSKNYKNICPNFNDFLEKRKNNHKILKIEDGGFGTVYDLTVDKYHNFALSTGVFVHNCVGYLDDAKQFIIRNSWGSDWGLNGYFMIPYEYLTNSSLSLDLWVIKLVEDHQ